VGCSTNSLTCLWLCSKREFTPGGRHVIASVASTSIGDSGCSFSNATTPQWRLEVCRATYFTTRVQRQLNLDILLDHGDCQYYMRRPRTQTVTLTQDLCCLRNH
jgi:hypothetical protein